MKIGSLFVSASLKILVCYGNISIRYIFYIYWVTVARIFDYFWYAKLNWCALDAATTCMSCTNIPVLQIEVPSSVTH